MEAVIISLCCRQILELEVPSPVVDYAEKYLVAFLMCITAVACYRFSNTTAILQKKKQKQTMWFIGVEVEQERSALPPKKNPGSAPGYPP